MPRDPIGGGIQMTGAFKMINCYYSPCSLPDPFPRKTSALILRPQKSHTDLMPIRHGLQLAVHSGIALSW